jgi:hypothetical protein
MMSSGVFSNFIRWIFTNFDFAMYLVAVVFIIFHRLAKRNMPESEIVYRWTALFALGFTCIYAFILHAYFPNISATAIGWKFSPFQFEVAVADLAIGLLGILSFRASFGFRVATVVAASTILWGDAVGHISQMILHSNYSPGNAGTWFWMDVAIPFILIIAVLKIKEGKNEKYPHE